MRGGPRLRHGAKGAGVGSRGGQRGRAARAGASALPHPPGVKKASIWGRAVECSRAQPPAPRRRAHLWRRPRRMEMVSATEGGSTGTWGQGWGGGAGGVGQGGGAGGWGRGVGQPARPPARARGVVKTSMRDCKRNQRPCQRAGAGRAAGLSCGAHTSVGPPWSPPRWNAHAPRVAVEAAAAPRSSSRPLGPRNLPPAHLLEAPLQPGVLLNELPVLVERGAADAAHLAPEDGEGGRGQRGRRAGARSPVHARAAAAPSPGARPAAPPGSQQANQASAGARPPGAPPPRAPLPRGDSHRVVVWGPAPRRAMRGAAASPAERPPPRHRTC
jgi:hypothetical protein